MNQATTILTRTGVAYKLTGNTTVAGDFMRIGWGEVDFLNDKSGIGYPNQNVYRIGISHQINERFEFRAGYNHADRFAFSQYANNNFMGPGISYRSYAFGVSYKPVNDYEVNLGYEKHLPEKLEGSGPSTGSRIDVNYGYILLGVSKIFN